MKSSGRPDSASSQSVASEAKENEFKLEDDVYEEISVSEADIQDRIQLMK